MLGENAERRRAAPISSATEWKRFLKISSSAELTRMISGSAGAPPAPCSASLHYQIRILVHAAAPVWWDNRGRAVLDDDCGPPEPGAGPQSLALVESGVPGALAEPDRLPLHEGATYPCGWSPASGAGGRAGGGSGRQAPSGEFSGRDAPDARDGQQHGL